MDSQQTRELTKWPSVSKKRRALAIYVDFLLFSAFVALVAWLLGKVDPDLSTVPLWIRIPLFLALEALLLKLASWSPGYWALGIGRVSEPGGANSLVVDPSIKNRERWWTILFGVLAVLDGTKSAVRWALWHPPIPFMRVQLSEFSSAVLSVAFGSSLCVIAVFILRCHRPAVLAGLALYSVDLVSAILSYDLWTSWAALDITARREYQGLPVREGEVELMQQIAPAVAIMGPTVMLAWLGLVAHRFRQK